MLAGLNDSRLAEQLGRKIGAIEEPIECAMPIIDAHHHLRIRESPGGRYLLEEFLEDVAAGGHNIVATVAIECGAMYRAEGPLELRPIGETEFLNGAAAMSTSGNFGTTRVCAGIVGFAELRLGARVRSVLEDHITAARGRFRGIRTRAAWYPSRSSDMVKFNKDGVEGILIDRAFREGFACLGPLGLTFDSLIYHTQIPELIDLARAYPDTIVIINHYGGPLGAGTNSEIFNDWRTKIRKVARCPNICIKLGGIRCAGIQIEPRHGNEMRSLDFAAAWRPYIETCIEAFGSNRCMFVSNFPSDKSIHSYVEVWNAFKRLTERYSNEDRAALFIDTAARVYRLPKPKELLCQ